MYSVTHLPQSKFHHFQATLNPALSTLNKTQEIIFIDSHVSDIDQLIAGTKPNAAVYILHPQEDGIAQITSILKSHAHLQAIHIVSHGLPGCVFLGNSVLNLETLKSYTSQLQSWSVPYLLLYGCHVGKDQAFIQQLSHLTQSIIAASDDVTGNPKLGGDWDLEITTGNMNISLAFEPEVRANYPSVLGAELLKDIVPGSSYPSYSDFTNVNNTLYFEARTYDSTLGIYTNQLWTSNGAPSGTQLVKNFLGDNPTNYIPVGNSVYFTVSTYNSSTGYQYQLWNSNGTATGTKLVKNFGNNNNYYDFTAANNTLYFTLTDSTYGKELWKSDGTTAGTTLVKDIKTGSGTSYPTDLTNVNGTLYFIANNGTIGNELWKTNGTEAGTTLVKDIRAGSWSSSAGNLINVNGTLFFTANDGIYGDELWKTDGTTAGTTLLKDIVPGSSAPSYSDFTPVGNLLYFETRSYDSSLGIYSNKLWKSNGTETGTTLVKNFLGNNPDNYIVAGNNIYFTISTYNSSTGYQYQLWKSNGTETGTTLVKDFGNNSSFDNFIVANNILYFTMSDSTYGKELWKSDGTTAGTTLLKDIRLGSSSSYPGDFTNVNGALYFTANDNITGYELWKTNGTTAGTTLVKDINLGSGSSSPNNLINVNGVLYFTATDGINGYELWRSTNFDGTSGNDILTGTPGNDNLYGYAGNDVINALAGNDLLNGGTGADQLKGNAGNDTYVVDNAGDIVTELASEGTDLVQSSVTYTLPANVENLTLIGTTAINGTGNTVANIITGNAANNTLDGSSGADQLKGSTGDDTYVVDNAGDIVTELASAGTDLIQSSVTYTLPANVENLTLTGTTAINGTGNTLVNTIIGNTANNILNGGTGADQLKGSTGNDTYVVDNALDVVTELASGGTDLVQSSVTYTLPVEVENLTLTGTTAINGTGNALANTVTGNTANNILNGSSGADQLKGSTGNDTYVVDNAGDIVTELASEGTDLIQSSVTYTLPGEVENLTLTGTTAINGTGNTLANIITGNTANNILNGSSGADQLLGGDGNDSLSGDAANDTLTGGLGADKFIYNTNAAFATSAVGVDTITDFTIAQGDQIVLDKTTFTSISSIAGTGFSVVGEFAKVTTDALAATSAADIVYNTATGGLFYNQNGTAAGFGTGAQFLTLTNKPALTATQFVIQA
ncbi:conserved hypothetical protein [Planktothrix tepida PCC 9214]|uniref:DUF4347 domain-containing protein n=1 Tax=Planktothrix tepida PCC 9214 TaxID=671072 RepID=A0A1J1LMA6_9CYAN|nr:ELWxxDGT repeat protein [Planktothrix tepida]CUR33342.1 conserved hypothetical protein [Planktothrix tepida PCC 9214]